MNKKVAIVVCAFPPQGGGIGNNAYYHLKKLTNLGYQVEAFTPQYKNTKKIDNLAVKYLPVFLPIGKAGFLFSLFYKLKNFDIIHLYYPFFGTDLVVAIYKFFNRDKKLIIHYQMDPVGTGYQKIIFKLHLKLFLIPLLKISDKIFVLSWDNAEYSYFAKYLNKNKNKFTEVPNGIDTDIFKIKPKNESLANQYNISKNDKVIIFTGGLDDQHFFKGVDILLKSFSQIVEKNKETKLIIIGDGNKKTYYEKISKDLGVADQVIFTGWIDNEKLADYYNLGHVFVLPSTERTESFGIVIAEAQACGLPAIVSNWPGSRMTIEDKVTGFVVEPKNSDDLAEKIIKIITDDNLKEEMSKKASLRAKEKYSWDNIIVLIDSIYRNL